MDEQNNTPQGGSQNNGNRKNKMPRFSLSWLYVAIAIALGYLFFAGGDSSQSGSSKSVTYTVFKQYVEQGYASRIVANKDEGTVRLYVKPEHIRDVFQQGVEQTGKQPFVQAEYGSAEKLDEFISTQQELGNFQGELSYKRSDDTLMQLFWNIFPLLLIIFVWMFIMRRMGSGGGFGGMGGIFNVGRSRAQLVEKGSENESKVTFKDVAGQASAKQEVQEIVEFLKNPKKYTDLGGKIPKGALLVGPPGTGKTLLAKAVAGEANVPFMSMSGSDFVEMFVGVGASRVRDLFAQAKEKAPCIIFIDEIDAIGRARGTNARMSSNDERENTLNQLLTEMDGFGTNSGVIILAATNRADILDKALLRAGRFDRQIHVDLPELGDRIAIFKVHMKPLKLAKDFDLKKLARQTPGFSGADIANVCNEAALIAARNGKESVDIGDFNNAIDRIIGGLEKKSKVLTVDEKHSIAIHEAGHATISWHLQYAAPLVKVTIVPRGNALGAAWYMPEERQITTREQMNDELCSLLGGRAAEELFLGHISSGAANDLERVTKQCYAMVAYYGMSENLPNICYYDSSGQEYGFTKPYSEERAKIIDQEVSKMIAEQYARAKSILKQYAEGHGSLTQVLEDREVIFTEDVEKIFGPRPWTSRQEVILQDNEAQNASVEPAENTDASETEK